MHTQQPSMDICRRRAALEATLLVCHPDLGAWALRRPGGENLNHLSIHYSYIHTFIHIIAHIGLKQLMMLVASGDPRCQGVSAEVMCLAAANDSVSALLAPMYVCTEYVGI